MSANVTDIAIIGMAGKYPKANSPDKLWKSICENIELSDSDDAGNKNYISRYYSIDDVDLLDNEFFGFTPFDAMVTDPQHRILLKCAHEALENAGYEKEPNNSKIGVFATTSISTYLLNNILSSKFYKKDDINYPILIGNDKDFLATKVSYKLNLTGPSVTIQCGCSSSLVAVHYACQSLLSGECDIAVVGGVSISVPQNKGYAHKEGGIISKDGYCRPFDENASGIVKGNGCSVIVIRRLEDAIIANDKIHAVIKATAINNDGANKIGYTAPSISGESSVINEALAFSGLSVDDINYIETHGTGTKLGDPIEIQALNCVYSNSANKISLGSIKSNIGHLDVAAGITSIIKSIFMINEGVVPPIKNFNLPNASLGHINHNFHFPVTLTKKTINNIAINSFGIGGTNANAIISKYKSETVESKNRKSLPYYLVPIYFRKTQDLHAYKLNIESYINSDINFCDFVFSMATGKKRREKNLTFVLSDKGTY